MGSPHAVTHAEAHATSAANAARHSNHATTGPLWGETTTPARGAGRTAVRAVMPLSGIPARMHGHIRPWLAVLPPTQRAYARGEQRTTMSVIDSEIPGVDQIPPGTHFCVLYSGSGERDDLLFPFLSKGLRDGDTCRCYIDGVEHGAVRARAVGEAGVADPPTGRFDVRPA